MPYAAAFEPVWENVTDEPFPIYSPTGLINPVLTIADVDDVSCRGVADPCLFYEDEIYYMFFEVLTSTYDIGLAKSYDGFIWEYEGIVIQNSASQSFPQVFKHSDTYYMTVWGNTGSEQLYSASKSDFPETWNLVYNFSQSIADPTIHYYNNVWYLFSGASTCNIYYSNDFTDNISWLAHPSNPVASGRNQSRNAGRIIENQNGLYRVVQNGTAHYGDMVRIFEIDTLTTSAYSEHIVSTDPVLQQNSGDRWREDGMHTYSPVWNGDYWIGVVDGFYADNDPDVNGYSSTDSHWSIGIYTSDINAYNNTFWSDVNIVSGNEIYHYDYSMNFSNVIVNDTWVRLNDTDFNITSSNPIDITLLYLNNNMLGASDGSRVLRFSADTSGGSVYFNLSGFRPGYEYDINRDGSTFTTVYADSVGVISFSNSVWSDHTFDVYQGDKKHYAFLINESNGVNNYCEFTATQDEYEALSFYFKVDSSHDNCTVYLKDHSGNSICYYNISDSSVNFLGGIFTQVISADTWYKIVTSFDWDSNTVSGKIYGESSLLKSGFDSFNSSYTNLSVFNITGVSGSAAYVWFDNIQVSIVTADGNTILTEMGEHIYDAIGRGFQSVDETGNYLPLIVLVVVIFIVLSLILGIRFFGGSKNGGNDTAL